MQYSLRIPDDDELAPEFNLWMYDSPRENLELDIWRKSWLIWKKNITKIYELSVIEFVFSRWGIYQKNENTRIFKKRFFPTGMTMITKSSRYGIVVKIKYDDCTVFACYVLHYIETQRILWFNYMAHANLYKIHTDKIHNLSIYVRKPEDYDKEASVPTQNVSLSTTKFVGDQTSPVAKPPSKLVVKRLLTSKVAMPPEKFDQRSPDKFVNEDSQHKKPHKHCDTPRSNWFC